MGFRATSRALNLFSEFIFGSKGPSHTSIRSWVLKLSYYKLQTFKHVRIRTQSKVTSWAWILDHSIQVGKIQCLLILGVDLSNFSFGHPLRSEDCEAILLKPMLKSNGEEVNKAMHEAAEKAGLPSQICIDGGSDLLSGSKMFQETNPQIVIIRDAAHKVANFLKIRLEDNPAWKAFTSLLTEIKNALQQTDHAYFIPPSQRAKSRFMNIESNTSWSKKMLIILKSGRFPKGASQKIQTLFSRLKNMEMEIQHFIHLEKIGSLTRFFIRERGISLKTATQLEDCLFLQELDSNACGFAGEVIDFVYEQAKQIPNGNVLIGSSEIIESVFGRYKFLQGDRGCFGTTRLSLYLGACVGKIDKSTIKSALTTITEDCIDDWSDEFLGKTFLQKRRDAFKQAKSPFMGGELERVYRGREVLLNA